MATIQYSYNQGKTWTTVEGLDTWPLNGIWKASTAYTVGQIVQPTTPTGYVYECTVAGTSDASEPSWGTTIDGTTADNTVTWKCLAAGPRIVRGRLAAAPHKKRRIMFKISDTDGAVWGVREALVKAFNNAQEHNRA